MASASKDETVIIWNMDKIRQNLSKSQSIDHQDFIITMIDDHEHVIDCIKFACELACKTIQSADYSKVKLTNDLNQTNNSGDPNETNDTRNIDDSELGEETKRMDESDINDGNRLTTKEKVAKLKEDLKKRKAMLRGEIEQQTATDGGDEITIDTSKQEA